MGVLNRCHLMIGNDSGPTHMAAALGVPTVALFSGKNEPSEWAPIGVRTHLIHPPSRYAADVERGKISVGDIQIEDVEKVIECELA